MLRNSRTFPQWYAITALGLLIASWSVAQENHQLEQDWLIDSREFIAEIEHDPLTGKLVLQNGLIRRELRLSPNAATVAFDNLMTGAAILRGVKPEATLTLNGTSIAVGGLEGQKNYAFMPDSVDQLTATPTAFQFAGLHIDGIAPRLDWKQVRHVPPAVVWPPRGKHVMLEFRASRNLRDIDAQLNQQLDGVTVEVHYDIYNGLPLICKWIRVINGSEQPLQLDSFASELLAVVEGESYVEHRPSNRSRDAVQVRTPDIHVETDYAMGAMDAKTASAYSVHWEEDPQYDTQVNYLRKTPCMLRVGLNLGPKQTIPVGEAFTSFRAFIMPLDSSERERCGLAQRRMYRTLAPWAQENPLMLHARFSDPARLREAIDQAAEVGFEMVILTFGSGVNMEDDRPEYMAEMKELADYAANRGVELGGYSLLSSRTVGNGMDNEPPSDLPEAHGNSPNLVSAWGREYFAKLKHFVDTTGFDLLEHDGPYPGDFDSTPREPWQRGLEDSQYAQWKAATDFYGWLRGRGVYLNQPDWYFLNGANKTGMGYREVNWSLPRREQQIHTRQNIFDGTWTKTPSMGWMFVPLTEYHGGGAAATIEPLHQNLDHYEMMLASNLLLGVQACYRGPRLYDTPETKAVVKKWVDLYKQHREILESDLIHLRRADGNRLDFMLHVNPTLATKGFLAVFNSTDQHLEEEVKIPLYYTGLVDKAKLRIKHEPPQDIALDRQHRATIKLSLEPRSVSWMSFE